jgi:predicted RNA-binding protein with PIN domain
VLEVAVVVAKAGADAEPAVAAPVALRPFLHFSKLPQRALSAAQRVLDTDEPFRERVRSMTSETEVGRAGWLMLTRPAGWEQELAALVDQATTAAAVADDEREERTTQRRLVGAEERARRFEEAAADARTEVERAHDRLQEERRARREAEVRAEEAEDESERLRSELAEITAQLAEVRHRLAAAEASLVDQREVAPAAAVAPVALPALPDLDPIVERHRALSAAADAAGEAAVALARAIDDAGSELSRIQGLVDGLVDGLVADGSSPPPPAPLLLPPPPPSERPRRAPAPLPPAVFEDSFEAAAHLVRVVGVLVVVDGYNVSQLGWPEASISEQRDRLELALTELAARTGAEIEVVFDGVADQGMPRIGLAGRRAVRVTFSPPQVEADDVVIERAATLPLERPVVVASSDRRVQDGAREHGARIISAAQLLAVLRSRG